MIDLTKYQFIEPKNKEPKHISITKYNNVCKVEWSRNTESVKTIILNNEKFQRIKQEVK